MRMQSPTEEIQLVVGRIYRAKSPRPCSMDGYRYYNDRQIRYIGASIVQFDSPAIKRGSNYQTIPLEDFRKWADRDVTNETPEGDWNAYTY